MNTRNSSAVIWVDTSMHRATLCEMDGAIGPDAYREILPPRRSRADNEYRARTLIVILVIDALAFAAMGVLIKLF